MALIVLRRIEESQVFCIILRSIYYSQGMVTADHACAAVGFRKNGGRS